MRPEISVIIPVYNAAPFLRRCLGSLQAQTFRQWQAVCVDDGSTDSSPAVLDSFAAADSRITVVHKRNEGVSKARNDAMLLAQGRYIVYLDSDDFLHPQAFEICMAIARKEHPDLIAYTYDRTYRTAAIIRNILHLRQPEKTTYRHYDADAVQYITTGNLHRYATERSRVPASGRRWAVKHCQPWRCFYSRHVVEDVAFIPGIMYEDFPWWGEVMLNVKKAVILNLPLYFYHPNRLSYIMSSKQDYRIRSLQTAIEAAEKIYLGADDGRREAWEKNFIVPFREKLASKLR